MSLFMIGGPVGAAEDVIEVPPSLTHGTVCLGSGPWDGVSTGFFNNTVPTRLAFNSPSGATADFINAQAAGVSKFRLDASGNLTVAGSVSATGGMASSGITGNIPAAWLGVTGTTATAGNDARVVGAVQVGGDLGGTVSAPTVLHLANVTDASLASSGIASVAASKITGSGTLPDGVLSSNVPLLNGANVYTNAKLTFSSAPAGSANNGVVNVGDGPFDGTTAGKYIGAAAGTYLAINAAAANADLINAQVAGVSKFKVDKAGLVTTQGGATINGPVAVTVGAADAITLQGTHSNGTNGGGVFIYGAAAAPIQFGSGYNGIGVGTVVQVNDAGAAAIFDTGGATGVAGGNGTKFGSSATSKLGFFGVTPVVQQSQAFNTALAAVTDANAKTCLTALKTILTNLGLSAFTA